MFLNKFSAKKRAQQIIEFAFIAPILILVLLTIVEFGFAIFIRNVVSDGTRSALMQVNTKYNNLTGNLATKKASMQTNIRNSLVTYLANHNIPNPSNISVLVNIDGNGVATVSATYIYRPAFAPFIPGVQGIPLQSSQVINYAMLEENTFGASTTEQLSTVFPTPGGAIKADIDFGGGDSLRKHIAILVNWYDDTDLRDTDADVHARLFNWYGDDLLPPNLRINVRKATLEVRSPYYNAGQWFNTKIPYVWVVSALGYTQVYFVKYNSTNDIQGGVGYTLNATNIGYHYWASSNPDFWKNSNPLVWGQGDVTTDWYPDLYRVEPLAWNGDNDHTKFFKSLGYRWCDSDAGASAGLCNGDQSGTYNIQELALKGISREGWKSTGSGIDFHYNVLGNNEFISNTAGSTYNTNVYNIGTSTITTVPDKFDVLQHYTAQTINKTNYDGNYIVNIWQPTIKYYYTSATDPVDPAKLNDAAGPLFSAFKWKFKLNIGILNSTGTDTDLVDVYIDTDGDGIPDAWDDDPDWPDRDGNAIPDGLQWNRNCEHHDSGQHHSDCHDVGGNDVVKDQTGSAYAFPVTGVIPIISTPFLNNGSPNASIKSNAALKNYIPQLYYSDFRVNGGMLYAVCKADSDGIVNDLCRRVTKWSGDAANQLAQKSQFINGHVCGSAICIGDPANNNKSAELNYLENNKFSAANKLTRTPPTVW